MPRRFSRRTHPPGRTIQPGNSRRWLHLLQRSVGLDPKTGKIVEAAWRNNAPSARQPGGGARRRHLTFDAIVKTTIFLSTSTTFGRQRNLRRTHGTPPRAFHHRGRRTALGARVEIEAIASA